MWTSSVDCCGDSTPHSFSFLPQSTLKHTDFKFSEPVKDSFWLEFGVPKKTLPELESKLRNLLLGNRAYLWPDFEMVVKDDEVEEWLEELLNEVKGSPELPQDRNMCTEAWTPEAYAQFVTNYLGFEASKHPPAPGRRPVCNVAALLLSGDALSTDTYKPLARSDVPKSIGSSPRFQLVFIDPPFGMKKHRKDDEAWDDESRAWGPEEVVKLLKTLKERGLLSTEYFNVAMYCRIETIGWLEKSLAEWGAEAYPDGVEGASVPSRGGFKGSVIYHLNNTGPAAMQKGANSPGNRRYVYVAKFLNGVSVQFDGSALGGSTELYFPKPRTESRYGRSDVDALVKADPKEKPINSTQKSVEECRCLIRHLTPEKGPVLSVCNGVGTAMIAAALEGRNSVGVDTSTLQNSWACRRVQTFFPEGGSACEVRDRRGGGGEASRGARFSSHNWRGAGGPQGKGVLHHLNGRSGD